MIRLRRQPTPQPKVHLRKGKHRAPEATLAPGIRATTRGMATVPISPQTRLRAAGYVRDDGICRAAVRRLMDRFRNDPEEGR